MEKLSEEQQNIKRAYEAINQAEKIRKGTLPPQLQAEIMAMFGVPAEAIEELTKPQEPVLRFR